MKISLKKLELELKEMSKIEKKVGIENLTNEETNFLLEQIKEGVPRANIIYGQYLLFEKGQKEEAIEQFNLFLKNANGLALFFGSEIFAKMSNDDEEWIEWSMKCLRRSAWRQFPIAKMMLKDMKEHPFKFPEA